MKQRNYSSGGFTLAELLVATVLLSIVMASVYTLFHSVVRSWRAVEQDFDLYQDARSAITLFNREVDNILAPAGYLMEGEDDEITLFVVSEPMNIEESQGRHLMRVRYYRNRSKKTLMREEALVEMALPNRPPQARELDRSRIKVKDKEDFVVATGVRDFKVRYIWFPAPDYRDPDTPPPPVKPIEVTKHRERFGLPQGIEIEVDLYDPEDQDRTLTVTSRTPVRAPTNRMRKKDLLEMLGSLV